MKIWRWAVVGTGYIAGEFGKGMRAAAQGNIVAVVSRTEASGKKYAETFGVPAVYTDFEQMMEEIKPDVIYIAIPNDCHYSYIMKALGKGIPVLSEKPTVDNQRQMDDVLALAREKDLFFMEGMWTRCFPVIRQVRSWLAEGKIGRPLTVKAYFDIKPDYADWQPWKGGIAHAGGSLRDVGIYSLAMANMVFPGAPSSVFSVMHSNGEVDDSCRLLLAYGDGQTAMLGGAFNQITDHQVEIVGEEGQIVIGPEMWHPSKAVLTFNDGTQEVFEQPYPETGFQYEIEAVMKALEEGKKECADYTWQEMLDIAKIIEDTRKEWGIIYAADKEN